MDVYKMNDAYERRCALAEELYSKYAKEMPQIVRLSKTPDMNHIYTNIAEIWLHDDGERLYMMRACGVDEKYITGESSDFEKFREYCRIMPLLCGHPLYYSDHEELRGVFGCDLELNIENCEPIWVITSDVMANKRMTVADYISQLEIDCILAEVSIENFDNKIANKWFHPILNITNICLANRDEFICEINNLAKIINKPIADISDFEAASMLLFDHICENENCKSVCYRLPEDFRFIKPDRYHADLILKSVISGKKISDEDANLWICQALRTLARQCKWRNMTLELYVGANFEISKLIKYMYDESVMPRIVLSASKIKEITSIRSIREDICSYILNDCMDIFMGCDIPYGYSGEYLIMCGEVLPIGCMCMCPVTSSVSYLKMSALSHRKSVCRVLSMWSDNRETTKEFATLCDVLRKLVFENKYRISILRNV